MATMVKRRAAGYSQWAWILQALSGVLLMGLLTLHIVAQHFMGRTGVLSYQEVVQYLRNPLVFGLETVFAATVLFHALAGVRAVVMDLGLSPSQERWLNVGLVSLGILMFGWVLALTLSIVQ